MISKKSSTKKKAASAPDERIFRLIFEGHSAVMLLIEPITGVILDANQAAVEFYGYPKSKLCDMTIQEINMLPPEQVAAERQKALVEERNYFIFPHRLASGEERIVEVHSSPIALQEKQVLFSSIHDITERRRAEQALLESEKRYRLSEMDLQEAQAVANIGSWKWNLKTAEIFWSDEMYRIFGIDKNSYTGRLGDVISKVIHPDDLHLVLPANASEFAEKKPIEYRIILVDKSIRTIWAESGQAILDDEGNPIFLTGIAQDITERKRAEEALRRSQQLLVQAEAISQSGSWMLDILSGDTKWSDGMYKVFQVPNDVKDRIGAVIERIHPDDIERYQQEFGALLAGTAPPYFDYRIILPDSGVRHISSQASMEWDADGNPVWAVGTAQDITERKQAEEQILHERRILEFIAADASLTEILTNLVLGHEKLFPGTMCSVLLLDASGKHLVHGAAPSLPAEYVDAINGVTIGPNVGSCGTAAFTGETVIVTDIETDPRWVDFRGVALPHGLRACWSVPFRSAQGAMLGTFAMYYREPRTPEPQELATTASSARLAGIAIERKQAEDALRQSEAHYHLLADHMTDKVWLMDMNLKLTYASPSVEKRRGYTFEELRQMPLDQNLTPASLKQAMEVFSEEIPKAMADPTYSVERTLELEFYRKDGSTYLEENKLSIIRDENGNPVSILGEGRDITERKRAEDALRASEEKFRNLFNNSEVGMFRVRLDGSEVLEFNEKYLKILNYTFEELKGLPSVNLWADKHEREQLLELLNAEGLVTDFECRMLSKQGSVRTCIMSVRLYGDTGILEGSIQDITERKLAEEQLLLSEETYRGILNSISDAVYIQDANGLFLDVNQAAEKMYGYAKEDFMGRTPEFLSAPGKNDLAELGPYLEKALNGEPQSFEFWGLRKDGTIFLKEVSNSLGYYFGKKVNIAVARDITERKRAEATIYQRVNELETLNRISLALRSVSKQHEMLSIVLDEALAILNTEHGSIELHNKTTDNLDQTILRGWLTQVTTPHHIGEGIAGRVFTSGETYISREFASDPAAHVTARHQIPPSWGGVCLPIRTSLQTLGVLIVSVPSERELDKDEIRLLATLSEMTGSALQRMQLHEQTVRRLEQLNGLRAVDQAIASSRDIHLTLNLLLTHTISQLKVDAADVLLLNPGSNFLELAAGHGFRTILFESVKLNDSFAGRAIMEHRSILALDSESAALHEKPKFEKLWKEEGFVCYWCVPLRVNGEVKGVLEVYRRTAFTPDAEWFEFLQALAGQAAIAIDNTQLFEDLQRSNLDLSLAYDATIEGWSMAMDLRDHETEGHTLRVTELTLKLARVMRISESQLIAIRRGALLHDIGKMGVPDAILLKEGKLTDEEWVLMRKHPQLAHDMLTPITYLHDALDIPYCHHEKWDGTGYPQGLYGDHIPLVARIFAVVDVWDAITNDRTYRKKWTTQKARQYIKEQSGKHFDPQVVDVFLDIIGEEDKTP